MKANKTWIVGTVIGLAVGYLAGGYIGIPGVDPTLTGGDINKVNKYSKSVSEDVKVFQERMANDTTFRDETILAMGIVDERVNQFKNLTDSTALIAGDIKELKESVDRISELKEFAAGAQQQADSTLIALSQLIDGQEDAAADYEQLAQNTFMLYTVMDNQKDAAREFVTKADEYLKLFPNTELADLRNKWVAFCGDGAVLNDDKVDMAYWAEKDFITKSGEQTISCPTGIYFNKEALSLRLANNSQLELLPNALNHVVQLSRVMRNNDVVRSRFFAYENGTFNHSQLAVSAFRMTAILPNAVNCKMPNLHIVPKPLKRITKPCVIKAKRM